MDENGALAALAGGEETKASVIVNGATLIEGTLKNIRFDMIQRTIGVTGQDMSEDLHQIKSAEKWVNKSPSDIVSDLAQRVGLSAQIDKSTLKAGRILKDEYAKLTENISYASVLQKMAELDGARWFVKGTTLHYVSQDNPSGVYSLNYSPPAPGKSMVSDCLHLVIDYNVDAGSETQISTKAWHSRKKKMFQSTATVQGIGGGQTIKAAYHIPSFVQDQVKQFAKVKAQEMTRHAYHLEAECVGDTTIDVAMALELTGTEFFDQQYQIDEIKHIFGMTGYTMNIRAATAGEGRSSDI